jgi:phosphopantothenoylcysteine decarboxylase/phosphopantothenate--cysteine ligase
MGFALAHAAARRGAQVTAIAANVALPRDPAVEYADVVTAAELAAACEARFDDADVLLMAAAVADFRPAAPAPGKLKKDSEAAPASLALEPTRDVLSGLAARRRDDQILIGFAAEHGPGAVAYARAKLERKGLDAVVVNDVSDPAIGFDAPDNEVTLITRDEERVVPRAGKAEVAGAILDLVLSLRSETRVRVGP